LLRTKIAHQDAHDYVAVALRLPLDYDARTNDPYRGAYVLTSTLYYGYPAGAPVDLYIDSEPGSAVPAVNMVVSTGECRQETGCPIYSGRLSGAGYSARNTAEPGPYLVIPPGELTLGVWHEIVYHVYWTSTTGGFVEAWHRRKGQASWIKRFRRGGFPTLSWGANMNCQAIVGDDCWIEQSEIEGKKSTFKFGLYGPASPREHVASFDNVCESTTFEAAASCFG